MRSASCTPPSRASIVGDVVECAQAAGDVARWQRRTFERGDHADRCRRHRRARSRRRGVDRACSPNDSGTSSPPFDCDASSGATGSPYTPCVVTTRNATGWMGTRVPGGRTGRWTPFWPPSSTNSRRLEKLPNSVLYTRALRADRERLSHLRDHHTDLTGGYLHPRELLHAEHRPDLEAQSRHEQRGLVAGFAAEPDRVVLGELAEREPLRDEPDLGRADRMERLEHDRDDHNDHHDDHDHTSHLLSAFRGTRRPVRASACMPPPAGSLRGERVAERRHAAPTVRDDVDLFRFGEVLRDLPVGQLGTEPTTAVTSVTAGAVAREQRRAR